jgi:hypothetical protein
VVVSHKNQIASCNCAKTTLLSLLFLGGISCAGQSQLGNQNMSKEVIALADSIAKDTRTEGKAVGIFSEDGLNRYKRLQQIATNQELATLTHHSDAVVRCHSYYLLAQRKKVDFFPILLDHLKDTASVVVFHADVGTTETVGNYFVEITKSNADSMQQSMIDSILLFDKTIRIETKYVLLSEIRPNPNYYKRIKEIASTEKRPEAVLALARFKNKDDIEIIKHILQKKESGRYDIFSSQYWGIYCAREFSDSSFYPYLTKIFEQEWNKKLYDYGKWSLLFQALAKYPNRNTYQLFERTTKSKDEFRYQTLCVYLLVAIQKYPNQIFEPLKEKIKLDEYHRDEVKYDMDADN